MNLLPFYPGMWDRAVLVLMGLFVIVLAVVSITLAATRRDALAWRSQALAGGLCVGLATGLACGVAFLVAQSYIGVGFLLAPRRFQTGLLFGLGLGALTLLAIAAFVRLHSAPVVGLVLGAILGLVAFRLGFGPTSGFGGEVGLGVGREAGIMLGTAGGLLGGIAAHAFQAVRHPRAPSAQSDTGAGASVSARPGWTWPLIGLGLGGLAGVLAGALGVYMGIFEFLVPYNAQIPDVPPDTSPAGMLRNLLFGLGMFAVGGALSGCFLALQWRSSGGAGARRYGVWLGVGLVAALICGLSFGFDQMGVGGPLMLNPVPPDPVAGMRGLLLGLGSSILAVALLLAGVRITRAQPRWQLFAREIIVLAVGLLALMLPYWYTPIVGFPVF
ncbi:MAG: hypothetical protein ACM3N4_13300 [Nitrososphaerota archaeon]